MCRPGSTRVIRSVVNPTHHLSQTTTRLAYEDQFSAVRWLIRKREQRRNAKKRTVMCLQLIYFGKTKPPGRASPGSTSISMQLPWSSWPRQKQSPSRHSRSISHAPRRDHAGAIIWLQGRTNMTSLVYPGGLVRQELRSNPTSAI